MQADPHNARAHFRLAEIALFARNMPHAEEQARLALRDTDRLDDREQALARLVHAMASRDRFFLVIEARDPKFDHDKTLEFMKSLNPKEVIDVEV